MIKIWFENFWGGNCSFNNCDNVFTKSLKKYYDIKVTNISPDILFHYQWKGRGDKKFNCVKIGYIGENRRPNFDIYDYVLSNDYLNDERHFRYPVWRYFIDEYSSIKKLTEKNITKKDLKKENFCAYVVSSVGKGIRDNFFRKLSKYKFIDSYGKSQNNKPDLLKIKNTCFRQPKIDLLRKKKYKFVITFENNSYPGYLTEKMVDAMEAKVIPIYWGDKYVDKDFNTNSIINYYDFPNEKEMIDYIIELDNNSEMYNEKLKQPWFLNKHIRKHLKTNNLDVFLQQIVKNIEAKKRRLETQSFF